MIKAYDIRIYGRVFNVGFRRYVHRYGLQCNVVGYVENDHADDCVHIEAEGDEKDLDRFTLTARFRNKLFKKKNEFLDCCSYDSRTTNQYSEDNNRKKKNKIVSFTSVEIIDVESYKEYNKLDSPAELEMYEKNNSRKCDNCNCISF